MTTATTEEKEEGNIDSLEFVRLKIPRLIPVGLIENVKGRTFTADQFYKHLLHRQEVLGEGRSYPKSHRIP